MKPAARTHHGGGAAAAADFTNWHGHAQARQGAARADACARTRHNEAPAARSRRGLVARCRGSRTADAPALSSEEKPVTFAATTYQWYLTVHILAAVIWVGGAL